MRELRAAPCALALLAVAGRGQSDLPRYRPPGSAAVLPEGAWRSQARDVRLQGNRLCARLRREDGSLAPQACVAVQPGQRFANSDGSFAVEVSSALPYGTWVDTARDVRMEGSLLFASLQRRDLSWADTFVAVEQEGQTFENDDGSFRLMGQACAAMGECLFGYILKPNASHLYCLGKLGDPVGVVCNRTLDLDQCCNERMPCDNITTCPAGTLADPYNFCADVFCDSQVDSASCCIAQDVCAAMPVLSCAYETSLHCLPTRCLDGYTLRLNASSIECGYQCDASEHRDICCEPAERCSNLTSVQCPNGYYLNVDAYCAGATCEDSRDLGVCCQEALSCENLSCPLGTVAFNASTHFCDGVDCVLERDVDLCCYEAMPCSNLTCPHGFTTVSGTFCADSFCQDDVDQASCCVPRAPCTDLFNVTNVSCEFGLYFNEADFCVSVACEAQDVSQCCQVADPCSSLACPLGYNSRSETVYCSGAQCTVAADRDICCELAAPCNSSACLYGYVVSDAAVENGSTVLFCSSTSCDPAADNDHCCEPAELCSGNYACPHGYTLRTPSRYCDGVTCDQARDQNVCCEPAAPCTEMECGLSFIHVLDSYCALTTCNVTSDFGTCCTRGLSLQYFRFRPTKLRSSVDTVVQIADFYLYFSEQLLSYDGAVAYSPDGNYPSNEGPDKAIDGVPGTKWLDLQAGSFIINLSSRSGVANYSFMTANDEPDRDPVSWVFEGSLDGSHFVTLDAVEDADAEVPTARFTETPFYGVSVPCAAPGGIANADIAAHSCAEGAVVASGSQCTAQCSSGFIPTVQALSCAHGQLTPETFGCS